ncbi:hypothetical protein LCGC14_1914730 [marine sediment metagenome]|uniref:Uncharacterized protein n=1 Tax=marine sediment metagenome TaxID=412755 RepID=A0A0F9FSE4_9ZZZZ
MEVRSPSNRVDAAWMCLFYGLTDSGKTYLLGTAERSPLTSPCLFIDVDQGDLTLSGQEIDVVTIRTLDELQELWEFMAFENEDYRSLCFDGFTSQHDDATMPAVMDDLDSDMDLTAFKIPTLNNWGTSMFHVKKVLRAFKILTRNEDPDKRIHVFASALEHVDERRDLGVPGLPGKLGLGVGAYVDVLARLVMQEDEQGKEVRYLRATKHIDDEDGFTYLGKNRLRLLPRRMKNPSIPKIMKRLAGEEA